MPLPLPSDPVAACLTANGLTQTCEASLAQAEALAADLRALAQAEDAALTWDATFGTLDRMTHALQEAAFVPQLLALTHPDSIVRAAAMAIEPKVDSFNSALLMDDAVATTLRRAARILPLGTRSSADQRLVEHTLRDYRRNGLELSPEKREVLRGLNEALTKKCQAFEQHIAADTPHLRVRPEQLAGLSAAFRATHPTDADGLVTITTNTPDLVPFLRDAEDRDAAQALSALSQNRAREQNLPLLDDILKLRKEKATLLGYATWAHFVLETRMAKTPETVHSFLQDLHQALVPQRQKEFTFFEEAAVAAGLDISRGVRGSDAAYLEERLRTQRFSLNAQEVSQYFEVTAVQKGIFDIASALYHLAFVPVDSPVWDASVEAFEMRDARSGTPIGRLYLDLFPRPHKYSHAAMFGLRNTLQNPDGSRLLPIAALVCNFPPSTPTGPGLLSHTDVVTFFHEFGHLLHQLLSTCPLASFAGVGVAHDFVEAPSQLFEEWAWDAAVLKRIGRHHETGAPLPDTLIHALRHARTFCRATFTERQLFLATLDQTLHTRELGFNTSDVVAELHTKFSSFTRIPDTHFQASFGHLMGYDASYYGYQWALAIAHDLFTRFEDVGLMNQDVAQSYREAILSPGGGVDEHHMVQAFLGRPMNSDAYARALGTAPAK